MMKEEQTWSVDYSPNYPRIQTEIFSVAITVTIATISNSLPQTNAIHANLTLRIIEYIVGVSHAKMQHRSPSTDHTKSYPGDAQTYTCRQPDSHSSSKSNFRTVSKNGNT